MRTKAIFRKSRNQLSIFAFVRTNTGIDCWATALYSLALFYSPHLRLYCLHSRACSYATTQARLFTSAPPAQRPPPPPPPENKRERVETQLKSLHGLRFSSFVYDDLSGAVTTL